MENVAYNNEEVLDNKKMEPAVDEPAGKPDVPRTGNIDLLMDVSMRVTVELGRTRMQLSQILELQHGSVIELDRLAGDPVDVFVNDCMVARGEVVVVDDKFGVRITEMVSSKNGRGII
ncbi:MAG TPA: flagellar motor switch protein FliN [Anaerolineales bacterium]|nr:flagellar motor switch protein FliN [Anaerolineales bacterium]